MDTVNGEVNKSTRNVTGTIHSSSRAQVDPTLTIENMAADAKATGDAIREVKEIAEEAKRLAGTPVEDDDGSFSGGVATADLDMGGYRIKNLPTPKAEDDAVCKAYVDEIGSKLDKFIANNGSNNLSGGGDTIINVGTPEKDSDAANKGYVDTVIKETVTEKVIYVETKADGSKEEHISGGNTTIVQVATPVQNTDAANKKYVDDAKNAVMSVANAAVKRSGDTMQGNLYLGGYSLKDVATPTENGDAVNKSYADSVGVRRDVLYVNSDIVSEYGEKKVLLENLDRYDEITIEFTTDTTIAELGILRETAVMVYAVGNRRIMSASLLHDGGVVIFCRAVELTADGVKFSAGGAFYGNTAEYANLVYIPTKIIGVKYGGAGTENLPIAEEMMFG